MLSKVALGTTYELTEPLCMFSSSLSLLLSPTALACSGAHHSLQDMEKPPTNYHSCHALAKTMPDPLDTGVMRYLAVYFGGGGRGDGLSRGEKGERQRRRAYLLMQ